MTRDSSAPAFVGERYQFPAVYPGIKYRYTQDERAQQASVTTKCLASTFPREWEATNHETLERRCSDCDRWQPLANYSTWNQDRTYCKRYVCRPCDAKRKRDQRRNA